MKNSPLLHQAGLLERTFSLNVNNRGGGIVYHRHDEKGLNWELGGVRSGAGVGSSGVSQESSGSSETWEAAFCRRR